jgi:hypothetical protein
LRDDLIRPVRLNVGSLDDLVQSGVLCEHIAVSMPFVGGKREPVPVRVARHSRVNQGHLLLDIEQLTSELARGELKPSPISGIAVLAPESERALAKEQYVEAEKDERPPTTNRAA